MRLQLGLQLRDLAVLLGTALLSVGDEGAHFTRLGGQLTLSLGLVLEMADLLLERGDLVL